MRARKEWTHGGVWRAGEAVDKNKARADAFYSLDMFRKNILGETPNLWKLQCLSTGYQLAREENWFPMPRFFSSRTAELPPGGRRLRDPQFGELACCKLQLVYSWDEELFFPSLSSYFNHEKLHLTLPTYGSINLCRHSAEQGLQLVQ